jgi:tagatose 1,6-diphosphate aldolase
MDLQPASSDEPLTPPGNLSFGDVRLRFVQVIAGEPSKGFVPAYHFRIVNAGASDVGHINFRIGDTEHVHFCAGHIGFEIREEFRGHGYAYQACCAIAPFVRSVYRGVMITCDSDNFASIKTICRLGARFIDEVPVPPHEPAYLRGSRIKRRYEWIP